MHSAFRRRESYVNFCARVSWDPCILATCVCRSLGPGSTHKKKKESEEKYRGVQRAERTTSWFASLADVFFRRQGTVSRNFNVKIKKLEGN